MSWMRTYFIIVLYFIFVHTFALMEPISGNVKVTMDGKSSPRKFSEKHNHILVTGGAGYIGVHTIVCLLQAGYRVTVVDNLVNSSPVGLKRAVDIAGVESSRVQFFEVDIADEKGLEAVFQNSPKFEACIHFAGLKAVGESVRKPLEYYSNNIGGTLTLLKLMSKYDCNSIIFSSSATVYGAAEVPIRETSPTGHGITNPYGRTKFMIEEILKDFKVSKDIINSQFSVVVLRYFNPVGSHPSGLIGEDPNGTPNNLMPFVSQVAVGRREKVTIFGNDYPTPDGTGVRDYIHVMDLAEGHLAALQYVQNKERKHKKHGQDTNHAHNAPHVPNGYGKLSVFNLGTGKGYSVLEMIEAMKKASGRTIAYEVGPRREGDIGVCYADPALAQKELKWSASRGLDEMCKDLWNWQVNNPNGYATVKHE